MTAKEAIKNIKGLLDGCCGPELDDTREAFDLAIKALEAQDGTDTNVGSTISRQAAIDALDCINCTEEVLRSLPSTQSEQRWIPVSETIDIPDHEVLCCDGYGEELIGWLSYNDDQWLCESDGEMMYDPIAWREKPEPYRAERRTDD